MAFSPRQLTETAVSLISGYIQTNITAALASIASIHPNDEVTTESPSSESYFYFEPAHAYRCPAVWVVDDSMDFRQNETRANFINSMLSINVTVKVEDSDMSLLTLKAWRYQAALHSLLDQTPLVSADQAVSIKVRVKRIKPSGLYTYANPQPEEMATFYKEYMLQLDVEFFENF